jgi:uncharacterized protein with HEPN domain
MFAIYSHCLTTVVRMLAANKIIQAYNNVNNTLVWRILVTDLPVLQQEVAQLLAEE